MASSANLSFRVFQKYISQHQRLINRIDSAGYRAMSRIGAILMRRMRGRIKRRIVTDAMRQRLYRANLRGVKRKASRRAARRIMATIQRRQLTVSAPWSPPIAHVPDHPVASIRAIYFAASPKSVVVGPVRANQVILRGSNRTTVPELLEDGGVVQMEQVGIPIGSGKARERVWVKRNPRKKLLPWYKTRTRQAKYAPRPFAKITLAANSERIRDIIASSMKRALP